MKKHIKNGEKIIDELKPRRNLGLFLYKQTLQFIFSKKKRPAWRTRGIYLLGKAFAVAACALMSRCQYFGTPPLQRESLRMVP